MTRPLQRPRCYHRCGKTARRDSRFCSNACAADWAEGMAEGNGDVWCPTCRDWVDESHDHDTVKHPTYPWEAAR